MEFNEEGLWDWSTPKEQGNEVHEEPITPPPSPIASTPIHESPSSSSLLEGSFCERPKKMRKLQDIYDSTEVTDNVTLFFCLLIVNLQDLKKRCKTKNGEMLWTKRLRQ